MRVAAVSAALFVIATAVLIGVVIWIVEDTQRAALMQANDDDIASVLTGFRQEGLDEAREILRQRIGDAAGELAAGSRTYMRIQGPDEDQNLGNLPAVPETTGHLELSFFPEAGRVTAGALPRAEPHIDISGTGLRLGDAHYLFVGRGTSALAETRQRILQAFLWVMLGSIAAAAGGGVILASRLIRRVDAVAQTCEGIIAGRFNERVTATGAGAEWDRLVGAINKMLNRISSLMENLQQVSSDIAHDLRTPLTRMRHRLETARTAQTTAPEHLKAIDQAIEDSDQILSLFAAVLRIAQIESGSRARSFQAVELAPMLDELCALFRPVAEDSAHTLECMTGPGARILGDPELLFQMLSNLVENAIRHTPDGSRIVLRLHRSASRVWIGLQDDGPGIPEAELEKVTRRFYRLEGSRSSPGHGLGLALVNAIAHLHGATLSLSNASPGLLVNVEFDVRSPFTTDTRPNALVADSGGAGVPAPPP